MQMIRLRPGERTPEASEVQHIVLILPLCHSLGNKCIEAGSDT
jgi:hypothetical protein